jgi:hypothetical protein
MKAGIYFTGSGPILLLTTFPSLDAPVLVERLATKGIKKFIVYEVPEELVQAKYGLHYKRVAEELDHEDDLRVLDYDGHHVFYNFSLDDLGPAIRHEEHESAA